MNERTEHLRSQLISNYYRRVNPDWTRPRILHWAKLVSQDGHWRWSRSDMGMRGKLIRHSPLHLYQTVMRIKSENPPRGRVTQGYLLGGPLFFDIDVIDDGTPFSLWRILDCIGLVEDLFDAILDRGGYKIGSVVFSGFRGIHMTFDSIDPELPIVLKHNHNSELRSMKRERIQLARSIGNWLPRWDWQVSGDIWRVSRVPLGIHGTSALAALRLTLPLTQKNLRNHLSQASPFSLRRSIRLRMRRPVPLFTFIDGETYGPYRKGWATKLPIAVALHLIWSEFAKPREQGPKNASRWFWEGWAKRGAAE
ncbi:MAG: hypothetical protein ACFFER_05645 [Candidatus Thorarchaeota archaeon]